MILWRDGCNRQRPDPSLVGLPERGFLSRSIDQVGAACSANVHLPGVPDPINDPPFVGICHSIIEGRINAGPTARP